ncbi:hypothetical protein [Pseudomonas rubra]|uniref:Uncharacterized protein n=1 Tax=Pseudomonas rubra TaxID=2942627 RepID=A0ABT5P1N6_9PSED|nr:hypothetical protein [Pseudomonas rubra]MDD1012189.1 hypothetical protein [Pseudomonas rubra]MDD1038375.1 hypothetical protein [Pseudomonas rubra]MDD1153412.1 hypothetical protein [Pseudomonas rubra]
MGITEEYWAGLSEDRKVLWRCVSGIVTFFAAFFVTKTGVVHFDILVALVALLFRWSLIESQRSRARHSVKMRRMLARCSVVLGVGSVLLAAVLYFMNTFIFAIASVVSTTSFPILEARYGVVVRIGVMVAVFLIGSYAASRVFRELNLMGAFYRLPRTMLIKLVILRDFDFNGGIGLVRFELGVMFWTVFTVAAISITASGMFDFLRAMRDAWVVVANSGTV